MKRLLLALAFAGAFSSSALAQTKPPAPTAAKPAATGGVAADVNGDKIPMDDLNRIVSTIKASDPGLQTDSPAAQKALTEIKSQMLDQLIDTRLLAQEAKRQKIVPASKAVDDALTQLKTSFKTPADFQKWLQSDGKTEADVRRVIADELAIRELSTRLTADITVSANDVGTYYRANLDKFTIPETVTARHIMLAVNPNAPKADIDAVNKRAQGLLAQLRKKGSIAEFTALAKTNSDDNISKDNGGQMGVFARGEMLQSIEDACFKAKVGDIVGPVTTEFGVHLIRIDAKTPASTVSLDKVQNDPQLKALLLKEKVQALLDQRIAALKATAKIQKNI